MRRISLALALLGAVAAAGCGGAGGTSPASSGGNKGIDQASFKLVVIGEGTPTFDAATSTTVVIPKGGVVTGGGINCGVDASGPHTTCSVLIPYNTTPVALTATPLAPYAVWGWAGACGGTGACSVVMTDTRTIAIRFATTTAGLGAHPGFTNPAIHGVEYQKWANNAPGAYHCTDCHGAQGQGLGLAPSCSMCHAAPPLPPVTGVAANQTAGLKATIDAVTVTSPVTVTFHLTDNAGNPVDLSGADGKNMPLSTAGNPTGGATNTTIGFALGYFTTPTNSYGQTVASPYTILGYPALGSSPSMLGVVKLNDPTNVAKGLLVQTSAGHYTYTFPSQVQILPANLGNTHTLFMYATRQEDVSGGACTAATTGFNPFTSCPASADNAKGFTAVNVIFNFDPNTGAASANTREVVKAENCFKCHDGFKPKGTVSSMFHNAQRVDGRICNVCHNPARTSNPWANSAQFVHRIHAYAEEGMPHYACVDTQTSLGTNWTPLGLTSVGAPAYAGGGQAAVLPSSLTDASVCNTTTFPSPYKPAIKDVAFHDIGLDLTYPQDIRNCDQCHGGAAQGAQYNTNASPVACNSCHANSLKYWFGSQAAIDNEMGGSASFFVPGCVAGNEGDCIVKAHPKLAVSSPDPQGCLLQNGNSPAGCNSNTNAAYLANAGQVPVGADAWTYDVSSVVLDASGHPQITFRLLKNGAAVPFDFCTKAAGSAAQTDQMVLFNSYYGGPSLYFAWAVPQDGISTPADFNGSASAYLPAVCSEGHTAYKGANGATITGPDASQYYTVTLTYTANLTGSISMLTGGVGYTYNPSSTPPLTQTNVSSFPMTVYNVTSGKVNGVSCTSGAPCATKTGGLIVPAKNVWKVATGFTGRRLIVDNALCDNCHARLGARPTFHAGQRNDAQTCSFCHKPNQGSGGWAANASTFVHAVHGAEKRTVDYTWEGGCNIGSTWTLAGATQTVSPPTHYYATGDCIDNVSGLVVAPRFYYPEVTYPGTLSCGECHTPNFFAQTEAAAANLLWTTYAQGTAAYGNNANTSPYVNPTTVYGAGFGFDPVFPNSTVQASSTTLVGSPIMAACVSCHDDATTVTHMQSNGGHFYEARSTALVNMASEACLGCHGAGRSWDIAKMH